MLALERGLLLDPHINWYARFHTVFFSSVNLDQTPTIASEAFASPWLVSSITVAPEQR